MGKFIILIIVSIFISCKNDEFVEKPFFKEFDKVDYYCFEKKIDIFKFHDDLYPKRKELKGKDSILYNVMFVDFKEDKIDTNFVSKLNEIGYKKYEISEKDFSKVNNIFNYKKAKSKAVASCYHSHKHILVFKNKNRIIGITKLSLYCPTAQFYGANEDISDFGFNNEYQDLELLFKKYK